MLLTHYSRVTEIERMAGDLRRQIGELAALGRAADGKPDRGARLRTGVRELVLGWIRDHGTPLPAERVDELLCRSTSSSTPRASRPGWIGTGEDRACVIRNVARKEANMNSPRSSRRTFLTDDTRRVGARGVAAAPGRHRAGRAAGPTG